MAWINFRFCILVLIGLLGWLCNSNSFAIDAVVVRPAGWSPALSEWKHYRESQGLQIVELDAELGPGVISSQLAELYAEHRGSLRFLLLAGDVDSRSTESIPTFYRQSSAMVQFGGEASIATDNPYGDFDGDDIPEIAVARIPADSAAQLQSFLARVVAYEQNADFSSWRRNVHVVAGVGGFGAVADSVIEMTTRRFLADRIPGWSDLTMTQASTRSHYCPDPWRFSEVCLERMNQGGLFWVYIGHGHVKTLDYIRAQEEFLPILTDQQVPAVQCQHPPIAVFLACYTGAFDALEDSLAERLVLRDNGPIAAIAASRVSGPYGLSMLSDGLLNQFFENQQPTLGEVVLTAKRRMLHNLDPQPESQQPQPAQNQMQLISAIASALSPADYDLQQERREHLWQMHLLGDPMLRIHYPQPIELVCPSRAVPGQTIKVQGEAKHAGQLTVEFAYRREQIRKDLDTWDVDLQTAKGRDTLQQRYWEANNRILSTTTQTCDVGPFETEIRVPAESNKGRYCVRLYLEGDDSWQVGYKEVVVRQPRPLTGAAAGPVE